MRGLQAVMTVEVVEKCCQRTIAESVTIAGTGLHSGGKCVVVVHPAEADTGVVFAAKGEKIRCLASNVVGTARGTNIGRNGTKFQTIEHLMAAMNGLGIDNGIVEVSGPEMPALDGSALPYVEEILSVGIVVQSQPKRVLEIDEPVSVVNGDSFILAVPAKTLKITYVMSYDHPMIGRQSPTYVINEDNFTRHIAAARTFCLYEEIAHLISQDLALGGSIANAIVIWQDRYSSDLRFPDELARHKMLDLVGDLALLGMNLAAEIVAVKTGHAMNVELVRKLTEQMPVDESREAA